MVLENYRKEIEALCLKFKVRQLDVFGSVLTDKFNKNSDIDMIVDFETVDPIEYAENYFLLKFALYDLLQREIDLLEYKSVINPYVIERINNSKIILYAA